MKKGEYFKITSYVHIESKYQKTNNQMECGLDSRIPLYLHSCYHSLAVVRNLHIYSTFTLPQQWSHLSLLLWQFSKHITIVTQCCIIIPIPTLSLTTSVLNFGQITRTMSPKPWATSPETPSYITQNCMHVLRSVLTTIVTGNFST